MFVLSDDGAAVVNLERVSVLQILQEPEGAVALVAAGDGLMTALVRGSPARCYEGLRAIFEENARIVPADELDPLLLDLGARIGPPTNFVLPKLEVPGR